MAAKKAVEKSTNLEDKNKKLQKVIKKLKKEEHLMKWIIGAAVVIILILLLLLGYATDWARGLKTATGTTPISTSQDAATTQDKGTPSGDSANNSNDTTNSGKNGSNGANGTNGSTSSTTKETNTSSTTTNNSSTTNNNTTTESSGILDQLYNGLHVGETMDQVIADANQLGIPGNCTDNVLLKVCTFQTDGQTVTVKSLLVNDLVTSITRN